MMRTAELLLIRGALRVYALLCLLLPGTLAWAQDDDDSPVPIRMDDMENMEDMMSGPSLQIRFSDILLVILLVVSCYVFGKIWKGCIFIILAFAALLYFMK